MAVFKIILLIIQGLVSLLFLLLIASQSSKNEGFGTIGVQTPQNFKGKPGYEERMQMYTRNMGITWFVLSMAVAIVFAHTAK